MVRTATYWDDLSYGPACRCSNFFVGNFVAAPDISCPHDRISHDTRRCARPRRFGGIHAMPVDASEPPNLLW